MTFLAGIYTCALVLGLRPTLGARHWISKIPSSDILTLSPFRTALAIAEKTSLIIVLARALDMPERCETMDTISSRVIIDTTHQSRSKISLENRSEIPSGIVNKTGVISRSSTVSPLAANQITKTEIARIPKPISF